MICFVLTSLAWITQVMRHLYLLDKGVSITNFFKLIILIIPSLLFSIMPVVTIIAVLFVYQKLSDERQLIILKSSGLSELEIAKPALTAAMIITMLSYLVSAYLMPVSYNSLKNKLNNFKNSYVSNIVDVRKFNAISKNITIYVDKKNNLGQPEGIILFDNKVPAEKVVFFAKTGKFHLDNNTAYLELNDGIRQAYDSKSNLTKMVFDNLVVKIESDANENENRIKNSLELFIHEMLSPDPLLPIQNQIRLKIDGHQRIIWPMFSYVFTFILLSFYLKKPYNRKASMINNMYCLLPVIFMSFIHFSLQKLAYSNFYFIYLCYLNIIMGIIFSIWQCTRKTL